MKRLIVIAVAVVAAIVAAGCGGSGSGNATEDALSFMPKGAPVVVSVDTDPDGDQWKQVNRLIGKFPFGGQVKAQVEKSFNEGSKLDFEKDLKPILGNDLVLVVPTVADLRRGDTRVIGALKADDEGKAEAFVKKDATKATTVDGTDVYKESSDTYLAVKDGTIVIANTVQEIESALERHDGDHMTQDDVDELLAGVEGDGLLKVGVNVQQLIAASPESAAARKVKWVDGLRATGFVLGATSDGIEADFKTTTEGVGAQDLPLAAGAQSAPIVRRASDVGFGMRNLAQTVRFAESAARLTDPSGYAAFQKRKQRLNRVLGIDLDKDVVDQLQGDASLSLGIDGGFAVRSSLRDPAAFQRTLRKAAPKLAKAAKGEHVGIVAPKKPNGFYALATARGKKYVFAVIGGKFALATDASRAAQFAGQSATPLAGAKGSVAMAMDTRAIANAVAKRQGQSGAALITGSLGDFVGWVESETSGLNGHFKLNIK